MGNNNGGQGGAGGTHGGGGGSGGGGGLFGGVGGLGGPPKKVWGASRVHMGQTTFVPHVDRRGECGGVWEDDVSP